MAAPLLLPAACWLAAALVALAAAVLAHEVSHLLTAWGFGLKADMHAGECRPLLCNFADSRMLLQCAACMRMSDCCHGVGISSHVLPPPPAKQAPPPSCECWTPGRPCMLRGSACRMCASAQQQAAVTPPPRRCGGSATPAGWPALLCVARPSQRTRHGRLPRRPRCRQHCMRRRAWLAWCWPAPCPLICAAAAAAAAAPSSAAIWACCWPRRQVRPHGLHASRPQRSSWCLHAPTPPCTLLPCLQALPPLASTRRPSSNNSCPSP